MPVEREENSQKDREKHQFNGCVNSSFAFTGASKLLPSFLCLFLVTCSALKTSLLFNSPPLLFSPSFLYPPPPPFTYSYIIFLIHPYSFPQSFLVFLFNRSPSFLPVVVFPLSGCWSAPAHAETTVQ